MGKNLVFIHKMSFSILGTVATISGFALISKLVSVFLGASALLVFSQSRDVIRLSQQMISMNGNVSIVQYLSASDLRNNNKFVLGSLDRYSAVVLWLIMAVFLLAVVFGYMSVYIALGAAFFVACYRRFYMRHTYLLVKGNVRNYYTIQVLGLFTAIILSWLASIVFNVPDQIVIGSFWLFYGLFWLVYSKKCEVPDMSDANIKLVFNSKLFVVARDSLLMIILGLVTMLLFRSLLAERNSEEYAGYFDAGWSVSVFYMSFIFNALMAVLLPKFSKSKVLSPETVRVPLQFISAAAIVGSLILLYSADVIVTLLFSDKFILSMDIVRVMAPTEIFRAVSWYFSMVLLSKGLTRELLVASLIFNVGLLVSVGFSEDIANFKLAYGLINLMYLLVILLYVQKYVFALRSFAKEFIFIGLSYVAIWFLI